jgi:hypothetical protein
MDQWRSRKVSGETWADLSGSKRKRARTMTSLNLLLALFLVALIAAVGVALLRAWTEYRVRMAAIQRLEADPEALDALQPQQETSARIRGWQLPLTGAFTALIGIGAALWGYNLRVGQLAVGLYTGGQACIVLGVVMALFGLLARYGLRRSTQ